MATYQQVNKWTNFAGDVVYTMQLNPDESIDLHYTEPQTTAVLDAECDKYLADKKMEEDRQATIQKAIDQAFWTDEERENLG